MASIAKMSPASISIGPFSQVVTLCNLPVKGPLSDEALQVVEQGWIHVLDGHIKCVDTQPGNGTIQEIETPAVALPGLIDAHTHICFAGSRYKDYALRLQGVSYQDIAQQGGGIQDTMRQTRMASEEELVEGMLVRLQSLLKQGVTTVEVKSGYGLTVDDELKMLRAIRYAAQQQPIDILPTCLAAHAVPPEFDNAPSYLTHLMKHLLPEVKQQNLAQRVDVFIEKHAIPIRQGEEYLQYAKKLGFHITVHADQFTRGGSGVAARVGADSADHLEQSNEQDCQALKEAGVAAIVLPGATLGLGMPFPAMRFLLDQGLSVAIASDWNPGSAPSGNLLTQAALLGAAERLSAAETWAALTVRAAHALRLNDRGTFTPAMRADIAVYPCSDYREILYNQGSMQATMTWIKGVRYHG